MAFMACLVAVVDGLKGFPEAHHLGLSRDPGADLHPSSHGSWFVSLLLQGSPGGGQGHEGDLPRRDRPRPPEAAWDRLEDFAEKWDDRYPSIAESWRRHWQEILPMFAFAPEIRRLLYTTNAIESLHRGLRKIIKTRGHFPQ